LAHNLASPFALVVNPRLGLRQFVSKWKGALHNAIKKKWSKDHIDPEEDAYESSTFVYYKEAVTIV
jgi:hypothetical protein